MSRQLPSAILPRAGIRILRQDWSIARDTDMDTAETLFDIIEAELRILNELEGIGRRRKKIAYPVTTGWDNNHTGKIGSPCKEASTKFRSESTPPLDLRWYCNGGM